MLYISGMHALNLPCTLDTAGDWHAPSQNWDNPYTLNSDDSIYGDWGIETDRTIPYPSTLKQPLAIANHIRACLDLLEQGHLTAAQNMREGYIDNETYTPTIFATVAKLHTTPHWHDIDKHMTREYKTDWLSFKATHGLAN